MNLYFVGTGFIGQTDSPPVIMPSAYRRYTYIYSSPIVRVDITLILFYNYSARLALVFAIREQKLARYVIVVCL